MADMTKGATFVKGKKILAETCYLTSKHGNVIKKKKTITPSWKSALQCYTLPEL